MWQAGTNRCGPYFPSTAASPASTSSPLGKPPFRSLCWLRCRVSWRGWWRGRRGTCLTWVRSCRSGRGCSRWAPMSRCWWCCVITWRLMGGRCRCCWRIWRRRMRRGVRGGCRGGRRCRCSPRITRCGGGGCWGGRGGLGLPFGRPRPAEPSRRGGQVAWELADAGLHGALAELAREHQATVFMVLHAGLAVLLSRMGAGTDIPLGAPVAGRTDEAVHDLVGLFVNTLVLRADLSGDPGFGELLGRVREMVLSAQARQDVPFERLVEVLNPVRSLSRHPLFQVMLADEDIASGADWQLPGLRIPTEPVPDVSAKFDLTLGFRQHRDADDLPAGISAFLEYAQDLFDQATVRELADRLTRLLHQVARDPGSRVSELGVLSTGERRRLLLDWNDTARPVPAATLPDLFERQAASTPDAPAVPGAGAELTYGELNARANRLARHLISLGAGPESLVAIAMARSPEVIVAMLAVLKSGAAYVPVDPDFPPDRIAFMLTDTQATIVLTA